MRVTLAMALASFLAVASVVPAAARAQAVPTARTTAGTVAGAVVDGVERFLGIPYAAPPVGPLRWRAPQPAGSWRGTRPAVSYGSDCMQEPFPSDAAPLGTKPSEDCLTVNVWRPARTRAEARLPVVVWIYGGGNVNGGASPAVYSGAPFARDGVVFVSFNWRVGRFGFFGFPELTRQDADHGLLANYGYMDSIAALRWVRDNIAAFGGNPAQVTIYGQSAGAGQVAMLMTSPLARGLFARAIIQSGGGVSTDPLPFGGSGDEAPGAEQAGVNFAKRWGIEGTGAAALARLRALTPEQVTDGIHIGTSASQRRTYAGPVMDGRLLTGSLVKAVKAGTAARVPLLIGSTTADNHALMRAKTLDEAFATTFASVADRARAAYIGAAPADPGRVLREMGRDLAYAEPARSIATGLRAQGVPVYPYRFGYVADAMRDEWKEGPPHATDIPFAMDTVAVKYGRQTTAADRSVARQWHRYWVNFVRTGNPNGPGLPNWPVYDAKEDVVMVLSDDAVAAARVSPVTARTAVVAAARGR